MNGERLVRVLAHVAGDAAARGAVVSSKTACEAGVGLVGVSGAQLTLMSRPEQGESRYSTDEVGDQLEELRFTLGEGPCSDAYLSGVPVLVGELDAGENHERWPLFVPAAVGTGARATFAFPLRSGAIRMGVLLLYRLRPGSLTPEQVSDGLVLSDVVLSLLLDELTGVQLDPGGSPADGLPLRRAEIHQATGMLSVQLGVSIEEALVRLRAHAFAQGRPVIEVARDVVARRSRLSPPDST